MSKELGLVFFFVAAIIFSFVAVKIGGGFKKPKSEDNHEGVDK